MLFRVYLGVCLPPPPFHSLEGRSLQKTIGSFCQHARRFVALAAANQNGGGLDRGGLRGHNVIEPSKSAEEKQTDHARTDLGLAWSGTNKERGCVLRGLAESPGSRHCLDITEGRRKQLCPLFPMQ